MQVILIQNVKKIGNKNDVKNVSEGYARNFLFPRKLAVFFDEKAKHIADAQKKSTLEEEQSIRDEKNRLESQPLLFALATGVHGEVFRGITSHDIEETIANLGIVGVAVDIKKAIKTAGEHVVAVRLRHGITARLRIFAETIK